MMTLEIEDEERGLLRRALEVLEAKEREDQLLITPGTIREQVILSNRSWIKSLLAKL